MKKYYFNIYNDDVTLDFEGRQFADDHLARAYAVNAVRGLAAETVLHGHLVGFHRLEIVDCEQNPVDIVRFDEAVKIS